MKKIVCFGDSLTYGYLVARPQAWPALLADRINAEVLNKGICGDTTGGLLGRFQPDVVQAQPTHVIIMGGVNDLIWQSPLGVIKANIASLAFQSLQYGIKPLLGVPIPVSEGLAQKHWNVIPSWGPVNQDIHLLRQWLFDFSAAFGFQCIDFYQRFIDNNGHPLANYYIDGLHPTAEGNRIMADLVVL